MRSPARSGFGEAVAVAQQRGSIHDLEHEVHEDIRQIDPQESWSVLALDDAQVARRAPLAKGRAIAFRVVGDESELRQVLAALGGIGDILVS